MESAEILDRVRSRSGCERPWHAATTSITATQGPREDILLSSRTSHRRGARYGASMATINDTRLREILSSSPTIAVLGVHHEPEKAAFYVPEYLHDEGYRIIGVNPQFVGQTLFGHPVRATLAEINEPIDIVDVFRRSELVNDHVEDILAMKPRPKVVWLQLGIKNEDAAKVLEAAGITVVQNRCTLADHQRLGLGPPEKK